MAIVNNTSDEIGDVFIIRPQTVIVGVTSFNSFTDIVTGSWYKEFKYTTDGVNYSSYQELTNPNLAAIAIDNIDTFLVEYRYTNTANTLASFTSVTIDGDYDSIVCGRTYQNSIFNDFFTCTDTEVLGWCVNVTAKLYGEGIVPSYLIRGDDSNNNGSDDGYIAFWKSITALYAYIVVFARKFKDFREEDILISEFLSQKGIFFCPESSLADKDYLVENYYDQTRQRGSAQIYKTALETGLDVDGELLRTICYEADDEFIFNLHLPHTIGWSIGNCSPLYKGLNNQAATNKSYEYTEDFVDLGLYPTFGNGTQAIITDGSKEVYSILSVPVGEVAGLGDDDVTQAIAIDPNLSYEITFYGSQPIAEANLSFGALAYDENDVLESLKEIVGGTDETYFFERQTLATTSDYFSFRGIVYNNSADPVDVETSCLGGTNLQFKTSSRKIIPYIALDNSLEGDAVNELRIWDVKIRPIATSYSTGFVNAKNFISLWLSHNNASINRDELELRLRRFLLPYNTSFKVNYLNEDF